MDWPVGEIYGFAIPFLERFPTITAIPGFILVFFLPGFAWTLIFFKRLNIIERIALSFGLSIALITLSIIALNVLIGIKITGFNPLLIIIIIAIIPIVIYSLRRRMKGRSSDETLKETLHCSSERRTDIV